MKLNKHKNKDREVFLRFFLWFSVQNVRRAMDGFVKFYKKNYVMNNITDDIYPYYKRLLIKNFGERGSLEREMPCALNFGFINRSGYNEVMKYVNSAVSIIDTVEDICTQTEGVERQKLLLQLRRMFTIQACYHGYNRALGYTPSCGIDNEYHAFGEPLIIVHIPKITVTCNEDESSQRVARDLFFVVPCVDGILCDARLSSIRNQIGLGMVRTTFTQSDYQNRYVHSHHPALNTGRPDLCYAMCVGSNSPIIDAAHQNNNWMKTHYELPVSQALILASTIKVYAGVESTQGGPYMSIAKLSNISESVTYPYETCQYSEVVASTTTTVINDARRLFEHNKKLHWIKFVTDGNSVKIANSDRDAVVQMTNLALYEIQSKTDKSNIDHIDWKSVLGGKGIEVSIDTHGNLVCARATSSVRLGPFYGESLTFNGEMYQYKVIPDVEITEPIRLLKPWLFYALVLQFQQLAKAEIINENH